MLDRVVVGSDETRFSFYLMAGMMGIHFIPSMDEEWVVRTMVIRLMD